MRLRDKVKEFAKNAIHRISFLPAFLIRKKELKPIYYKHLSYLKRKAERAEKHREFHRSNKADAAPREWLRSIKLRVRKQAQKRPVKARA